MSGVPVGDARRRSWRLWGPAAIDGELRVPGDKSISHRALLLGAMAHGTTVVRGLLVGDDCRATLTALRALGAEIGEPVGGAVRIRGGGLDALSEADGVLDAGNSGTTLRLLAGLLAGRPFSSVCNSGHADSGYGVPSSSENCSACASVRFGKRPFRS